MARHQKRKGRAFTFNWEIRYNSENPATRLSAIRAASETKRRCHMRTFAFIQFPTSFKVRLYIIVSNCYCNKLPCTYWQEWYRIGYLIHNVLFFLCYHATFRKVNEDSSFRKKQEQFSQPASGPSSNVSLPGP